MRILLHGLRRMEIEPMGRKAMFDWLMPLGVLALWIIVIRWVLPWMGVPT